MNGPLLSIGIKNFRSIQKALLRLHSNVNVIIGTSDEGKSNVIKALCLLAFNRPSGFRFKTNNVPGNVVVTAKDKNTTYTREKAKSGTNIYRLSTIKKPFKVVGRNVPEEVSEALNISELNIQTQFEGFFLLNESGGKVAQKFNTLVGLEDIDVRLKKSKSIVSESKRNVEVNTETLESQKSNLKRYSDLDVIETLVSEAENADISIASITEKVSRLATLYNSIISVVKQVKKWSWIESAEQRLTECTDLQASINDTTDKLSYLQEFETDINDINTTLSEYTEWLKVEQKLTEAEIVASNIQTLQISIDAITAIETKLTDSAGEVSEAVEEVEKLEIDLTALKNKLGLCPLCNSTFK